MRLEFGNPFSFFELTSISSILDMSSTLIWEDRVQKKPEKEVKSDSNIEGWADDRADRVKHRDKFQPDSSLLVHFQENTLREYMRLGDVPNNTVQTSPLLSHVDIFTTCTEVLCSCEEQGELESADPRRTLQKYAASYWMAHFKEILDIATSEKDYTISAPDEVVIRVIECFSHICSNKMDVVKVS